jgi:large subunit ribosomal protein L31
VDEEHGGIAGRPGLAVVKVWHRGADTTLRSMKTDIHPEYVEAHVRCTCGNEFTTRSTQPEIHVEICSNCHPFYTGKQKLVDTGGRVERFQRRAARRARGDKS